MSTTLKVKNTSARTKAVRIPGGHHVLKAGESAVLDLDLHDEEGERYVAAGLKFKKADEDAVAVNRREEKAPVAPTAPQSPPAPPQNPAAARLAAVRAAAAAVDDADRNADGKPSVDAINAKLGEGAAPVTAAERDAALKEG